MEWVGVGYDRFEGNVMDGSCNKETGVELEVKVGRQGGDRSSIYSVY